MRSICLLCYLADLKPRHVINTATRNRERFNESVNGIAVRGDNVFAANVQ